MKKFAGLIAVIVLLFSAVAVYAKNSPSPEGNGPAGQSKRAHLYFYEKDLEWNIVEGGAWGKMAYDKVGDMFDFVFNGHRLNPGVDYTLIYYPDPWPGDGLVCLGDGKANGGAEVNIKGAVDTGNLPIERDENFRWNISGNWLLDFATGTENREFRNLVQNSDGNVTGEFWWLSGSNWLYGGTVVGNVAGDTIHLSYVRPSQYNYTGEFDGTIDQYGMSGTFEDSHGGLYDWSTEGEPTPDGGAKIWLVQSSDVECTTQKMIGWNQEEYLFEYDLINFVTE